MVSIMGEEIKIKEKGIFIRPVRLYYEGISGEELYEITRGVWRLSQKRRDNADYAFTVIGYRIKAVYRIFSWYDALETQYHIRKDLDSLGDKDIKNRYEFIGEIDDAMQDKYLDKDVSHYFSHGNANPVTYVNC